MVENLDAGYGMLDAKTGEALRQSILVLIDLFGKVEIVHDKSCGLGFARGWRLPTPTIGVAVPFHNSTTGGHPSQQDAETSVPPRLGVGRSFEHRTNSFTPHGRPGSDV
jgi:hypothetical protein